MKLSPALIEEISQYIAQGNSAHDAALLADVSESAFYLWLDRGRKQSHGIHHDFLKAIERARVDCKDFHIQNIRRASSRGEWTASAWYLERVWPEEFAKREKVEHSGSIQVPKIELVLAGAITQEPKT